MRRRYLLAAFWIALISMAGRLCAGQQQVPTVAELLTANGVPDALVRPSERTMHLNGFDVRKEGPLRLFAWMSKSGDEDVLTVARYDTATKHILRKELKDGSTGVEDDSAASRSRYTDTPVDTAVWGMCLHDVGFSEQKTEWLILTTHVNPSLGCTLLLDDQLQFHFLINGWVYETVGDSFVIEESMIHFAPTHPAKLTVFNPKTGEVERVYPRPGDPVRTAYQAKLRAYLASEEECGEKNLACDVESMDASVESVQMLSPTVFAFTITLSPAGMGERAEKEVPEQTTIYIAKLVDGKWQVKPSTKTGPHLPEQE